MTHNSSFASTIAVLQRMGRVPNASPARALVMRRRVLRYIEREQRERRERASNLDQARRGRAAS